MVKVKEVMLIHEMEDGSEMHKPHKIKRLKMRHINRVFAAVSDVLDGFSENPELEQVVFDLLDGNEFDPNAYPDLDAEGLALAKQEHEKRDDKAMMAALFKSSKFLLRVLPEQTYEVVSAMSNIDKELLMDQEPDDFGNVIEAIMEVNDIESLWERAKQVFGNTVAALRFKNRKTAAKAENPDALRVLQ